ncbi:MAG: hypothetical protein ACR2FY_18900 [Pirellulaceae bacterium]
MVDGNTSLLEKGTNMNDKQAAPAEKRRYPGRLYLWLGILAAVAGPVIYTLQIQYKSLFAPWYVPILATLGVLLIAWSLAQCRTFWRWGAAGMATLLAGLIWLMMLVGFAMPTYNGPATVGQVFPSFETNLAGGGSFQQADLRGDKDTILLFFRGRW